MKDYKLSHKCSQPWQCLPGFDMLRLEKPHQANSQNKLGPHAFSYSTASNLPVSVTDICISATISSPQSLPSGGSSCFNCLPHPPAQDLVSQCQERQCGSWHKWCSAGVKDLLVLRQLRTEGAEWNYRASGRDYTMMRKKGDQVHVTAYPVPCMYIRTKYRCHHQIYHNVTDE